MLKIGEFSKLAKTTVKTLRYYDKAGLLKPAFVDSETSYRYYTEQQLATIHKILSYKSVGMSCSEISDILNSRIPEEVILARHKHRLKELKKEITVKISEIDKLTGEKDSQDYTPCLKRIPPYTVFYTQSYIKDISNVMDFIKSAHSEFKRTNPDIKFTKNDYCCIIYPGESFRDSDIFVEYAQSVENAGIDTPIIKFKKTEPITTVSVTHYGSYYNIRDAYISAVNFALENNCRICPNVRERYIDGAWNSTPEHLWRTEIQIPVTLKGENNK